MRTIRIWYDTEFVENGSTIDLLTFGAIREDGREYYAINKDADWAAAQAHPFVGKHVVPHIGDVLIHGKTRDEIREDLKKFLKSPMHTGETELWGWYSSYDHIVLAQLFGTMVDFPSWLPQWTNDVRQKQHDMGDPPLPPQTNGLHNALEDARHTQLRHRYLETVL